MCSVRGRDWGGLNLFLDSHQWRQAQLFSLHGVKSKRRNNGSEPEKQRLKGGGESEPRLGGLSGPSCPVNCDARMGEQWQEDIGYLSGPALLVPA